MAEQKHKSLVCDPGVVTFRKRGISKKTQDSDPEHVFLVTGHGGEICDMKYCIVVSHLATNKRTSQITSLSYSVSNHKYKKWENLLMVSI